MRLLEGWIHDGSARACHDLSDGGLVVAAAEMAIGAEGLGVHLDVGLPDDAADDDGSGPSSIGELFGEAPHRFLVEVAAADEARLRAAAGEVPVTCVGRVSDDGLLRVTRRGRVCIEKPVDALRRRWRGAFADVWPDPAPSAGSEAREPS